MQGLQNGRFNNARSSMLCAFDRTGKHMNGKWTTMNRRIMYIACFCALVIALTATASATDYYVKTDGDDSHDGLSSETAWRTIAYAVSSSPSSSGDTIYVLDGIYSEGLNNIIFRKDGITLTAYSQTSPNVLVDGGSGGANEHVITVYDRNNINISKLEVTNGGDQGISVRRSSNVHISECHVHDCGGLGIALYDGTHHSSIDKCDVHHIGWNAIQLGGRSDQGGSVSTHLSITNCKVHDGINHGLIDLAGDMDYVDIIGNELYDNPNYGCVYSHQENPTGIRFLNMSNNHIRDCVEGPHFDMPLTDSTFFNNTIETNSLWFAWQQNGVGQNLLFKNNYMRGNVIYGNHMFKISGDDITFEGNDVFSEYGDWEYRIDAGSGAVRNAIGETYKLSPAYGAVITVEYTDGRTFSVDGNGEYTTYTFTSGGHTIEVIGELSVGKISGTVTDAGTGLGIEGATVTVEGTGKSDEADANGDYAIASVPTGTYTVTALKTGYQSQSKPAEVTVTQTTTTDFQLTTETTPPIITTHSPTGTNVPIGTTTTTVTFNDAMNQTSAEDAFSISPPVTGSFTWNGNTMIFTPSSNLAYETTYTVNINTEAEDLAGNNLESSYSWQFTTGTASSIVYVATDRSGDYNCDGINDHIEINQATAYISSIGGGTVHLKAGTYTIDDVVYIKSNMIFEGDGEGSTIIELDASNSRTGWYLFDVNNLHDVTLQSFTVDGNKNPVTTGNNVDAFHIYDSNNVIFQYVTVTKLHTDIFEFIGSSDCSVIYCKAIHNGHDGIMNWNCDNMTYTDNYFEQMYNVGVRLANTKNSRVERNICICNDFGISLQGTSTTYLTENNLIKDNYIDNRRYGGDEAIPLHAEGYGIIRNITFIGNIIAHGGTYLEMEGFRIYTSGSGRIEDIYIINNVIRDCRGEGGIYAQDVDRVKNIVAKNNIIVDSTYGIYGKVISSYNNFWNNANGNYGGGASAGTGDISVDPLFADYDFHLKSDSPCIDAGDPSSDYSNEPTPNGGRINIGAYGNTAEASKSAGITPDNPPTARAGSDQTVNVNTSTTFDGSASSDDYGIISYVWDFDASDGLQPDATGVIVSHTYTEPGTYIVTLTVTDTFGNTDTDTCMVTVNVPNNRAPILNQIGDKSISESALLEFTISASDPDNDPLTYSADNLPTGATFDPTARTFSWTPDYGQEGTYPDVHFEVTDGYLTDAEDITITVNNATTVHIRLEAEDADEINPLMEIASDPSAYNNSYIWVPDGGGWKGPGYARYVITITTPGDYKICGRVQAPTSANNSFLVRMDDDPDRTWTIPVTAKWGWDEVNHWGSGTETDPEIDPVIFTLSAGEHVLTIKHRECGTKLDRLLITNELTFIPYLPDTTPPVADAGQDQTVDKNTVVYFDGSGSTDDIGIKSYSWDFDASDGIQTDATGVTASHIYTEPGSYIVTLTVTDTFENTDNDTCMVTVNAPRNQMASHFGVNDTSGTSGTYTLVPVKIANVTDGPIQTIKFDILYNESILNLNSKDPKALQPGTLIGAGWWFMLGSNNHTITLTTAWQSLAIPDGSTGSVILLNFSVIGAPGATSYMDISEIELANTENELGTAPAESGLFSVLRLGTISGTIAYSCNKTAIAGAVVNLTKNGSLISSTTTDANGMYTFTDIEPGEYNVSVSKIHFWDNSTSVTVYIDQETVSDHVLLLRGDLNDNGEIADAADVNMMMQAFIRDIPGNKYFDLNENGKIADFGDVEMILLASIGELIL